MRAMHGNTMEAEVVDACNGDDALLRVCNWTGATVASWNARQLAPSAQDPKEYAVAKGKMAWLKGAIEDHRFDVIFVLEVRCTLDDVRVLRTWARGLGYEVRWLPEGPNGVAALVRKRAGTLVRHVRVGRRALGVCMQFRGEARPRNLVGVHGVHDSVEAFRSQMAAAEAWAADSGIAIGDMNGVLCGGWRRPVAQRLDGRDRIMRAMLNFGCACCGREATGDIHEAELIRASGEEDGPGALTRWAPRGVGRGGGERGAARLDYGVAFGEECGQWRAGVQIRPLDHVSDHALISVQAQEAPAAMAGPARVRATWTKWDPRAGAYDERLGEELRADGVCELVQRMGGEAEEEGKAPVEGVRGALLEVERRVKRAVDAEQAVEEKRKPARQEVGRWRAARVALGEARAAARDPMAMRGGRLFTRWTGLAKLRNRMAGRSQEALWEALERRVEYKLQRAERAARAVHKKEDAQFWLQVKGLEEGGTGDVVADRRAALAAISKPRGNIALSSVLKHDDDPWLCMQEGRGAYEAIPTSEPEAMRVLAEIGEGISAAYASTPAVHDAYRAWCTRWLPGFEELRGLGGGKFCLREELTFDAFEVALYGYKGGTSVGPGGYRMDRLRAAPPVVRQVFWQAMLCGLESGRMPDDWHEVLYVLLAKPGLDPRRVANRREIALMAQDMKLLLRAVRNVSYRRMAQRLANEQGGWKSGYGHLDQAAAMQLTIQQAARLQRTLYILYTDWATFFPRLDRGVVAISELLHGLPEEVVALTLQIYGVREAQALRGAECSPPVRCRYDSAGGLGEEFTMHMGALMGCVVSPDKAKLVLDSLVRAVREVARGVRMWGAGDDEYWAYVTQVAFADDHACTFEDEAELRKAWAVITVWELVTGSKLGYKARAKTVVTGVRYGHDGKAFDVDDPRLEDGRGNAVPFLRHDQAYKHLGKWRRADGVDADAWRALRGELMRAVGRVRRMSTRKPAEIILATSVLFSGIAGEGGETLYVTWDQAEEVERAWRVMYRRKTGVACDGPRAMAYEGFEGGGRRGRVHLWKITAAAMLACVTRVLADPERTPARCAAEAQVALAFRRWGCREEPRRWDATHVVEALEKTLEEGKVKYMADAFMMLMIKARRGAAEAGCDGEDGVDEWWRDVQGMSNEAGALRAGAEHFEAARTRLLFEPAERGGVGAPVAPALLGIEIAELGQMCRARSVGESALMSAGEAAREYGGRRFDAACRQEWTATVEWLQEQGVVAVRAERPKPWMGGVRLEQCWARMASRHVAERGGEEFDGACDSCGGSHCYCERCGESFCVACEVEGCQEATQREGRAEVDLGRVQELMQSLRAEGASERGEEEWALELALCFGGERARPMDTHAGVEDGRDDAREAEGVCVFLVADKERRELRRGGEAAWLLTERGAASANAEGGCVATWEMEAMRRIDEMEFDAEGWLRWSEGGAAVSTEEARLLRPTVEMAVRARRAAGAEAECERFESDKRAGARVNLVRQRRAFEERERWAARVDATHVVSTDGGKVTESAGGREVRVAYTCAAVTNAGDVFGGELFGKDRDTYVCEMVAMIRALNALPYGSRPLMVFDSTSPLKAWWRWSRASARSRQRFYRADLLCTLDAAMQRHEVVVWLWQTSHVGEPVNDWADAMTKQVVGEPGTVETVAGRFRAREWVDVPRGVRRWAMLALTQEVGRRLTGGTPMVRRREGVHFELPVLADRNEALRVGVLASRCQWGDRRRGCYDAHWELASEGARCPFGCESTAGVPMKFTWEHVQFVCQGCPEVVVARRGWAHELRSCKADVEGDEPSVVLSSLLSRADGGGRRGTAVSCGERSAVAGVMTIGSHKTKTTAERAKLWHAAVVAGLNVQRQAKEACRAKLLEMLQWTAARRLAGRHLAAWRELVARNGPCRAARMRAASAARDKVRENLEAEWQAGEWTEEEALARWRNVERRTGRMREMEVDGETVAGGNMRLWRTAAAWAHWRRQMMRLEGRAYRMGSAVQQTMCYVAEAIVAGAEEAAAIRNGLKEVTISAQELAAFEWYAWRRWQRGGGWGVTTREVKAEAERRRRRRKLAVKEQTGRWLTHGTCSGELPKDYDASEKVALDFSERPVSKRARCHKASAKARVAGRQAGRVERGEAAGGRGGGWWAVTCIIAVERPWPRVGTALDVLIRWKGRDMGSWEGGVGDGEEWVDSWEPISSLRGAGDRREARRMESVRYDGRAARYKREGEPTETRRRRVAGEERRERATARLLARVAERHREARGDGGGSDVEMVSGGSHPPAVALGRREAAVTRRRSGGKDLVAMSMD